MPEPIALLSSPPPMWPTSLPAPQADSMRIVGPPRVERSDTLTGPTRLRVKARTAPMQFGFTCYFTQAQMQIFEEWYASLARDHEGEFYARWIGGGRVVAFIEPYTYHALGAGWAMSGHVIRTRIDHTACDAFLSALCDIYRDDGIGSDIYIDDGIGSDSYIDDLSLPIMQANEC